jgi:hypothetical protein
MSNFDPGGVQVEGLEGCVFNLYEEVTLWNVFTFTMAPTGKI